MLAGRPLQPTELSLPVSSGFTFRVAFCVHSYYFGIVTPYGYFLPFHLTLPCGCDGSHSGGFLAFINAVDFVNGWGLMSHPLRAFFEVSQFENSTCHRNGLSVSYRYESGPLETRVIAEGGLSIRKSEIIGISCKWAFANLWTFSDFTHKLNVFNHSRPAQPAELDQADSGTRSARAFDIYPAGLPSW